MPVYADRRIDMPTGVSICRSAYRYAESEHALNNQMGFLDKWEHQVRVMTGERGARPLSRPPLTHSVFSWVGGYWVLSAQKFERVGGYEWIPISTYTPKMPKILGIRWVLGAILGNFAFKKPTHLG
jgi:hypothetical protein